MADAGAFFARRFAALAGRGPGLPAVVRPDGETALTRAELVAAADTMARRLAPLIPPGATVLLSLANGPGLLASFLALDRLGAVPAMVDATATADEIERAAAAVGAASTVTLPGRSPFSTSATADGLAVAGTGLTPMDLPPRTALLKLTSGSTGSPTAVAVTARQLTADAVQIMRTMGFGAGDVTLAAIPLTHSYGIGSCLLPLVLAGTPLVFPSSTLPAALHAALTGAAVSHFPAVPAMIRALADVGAPGRFPALRVCLAAGAPLAPADASAFFDRYGVKVHVFYGSSECGGITYDRTDEPVHAAGAVGTAMARVRLDVVDGASRPVDSGAEGRVRVRSRAVAAGTLPADDALRPGEFLTADLGVIDEHGRLVLTGRANDVLNVAGKKLHPEEVRRRIEAIDGVRSAVVVGLPDRHRGHLVAALVAVEPDADLTVRSILAACRDGLAPHKVPRKIVIVDELPVSNRGKLRRDEVLRLLARSGT